MFGGIVFLFIFAIVIMLGGKLIQDVSDNINESDSFSNQTKDILNEASTVYPSLWDNIFLGVFMLLWIGFAAAFFMLPDHPALAATVIILVLLFLLSSPILSNIFDSFASTQALGARPYPKLTYILDHYLTFAAVMTFTGLIVLFGRHRLG